MDNMFDEIFDVVNLDKISSKSEFDSFISKLINHPTPLREAVAYKLEDVFSDDFLDENTVNTILPAITDINPNVSRSICSVIKKSPELQKSLEPLIIAKIEKILAEVPKDEISQSNKNHAKNKLLFSLYWLLEALFYCLSRNYNDRVVKILQSTILFFDYTIREKTAQLLTKIDKPDKELIQKVKSDKNFYVNFYSKFI